MSVVWILFFVKEKKKGKEPKNSICDNFVLVMNFHWMLLDNFYGELVCGCFIGKKEPVHFYMYGCVSRPEFYSVSGGVDPLGSSQ